MTNKIITEANNFIRATSIWVAQWIELKKAEYRKKNEQGWKYRIEENMKRLRQEFIFLGRKSKGELGLKKKHKLIELNER